MKECITCHAEISDDKFRCEECEKDFKESRKNNWILFIPRGVFFFTILCGLQFIYSRFNELYLIALIFLGIYLYYSSKEKAIKSSQQKRKLQNHFKKIEKKYLSELDENKITNFYMENYDFISRNFKDD